MDNRVGRLDGPSRYIASCEQTLRLCLSLNEVKALPCSNKNFLELAKLPSALTSDFEAPNQFSRQPGELPLSLL